MMKPLILLTALTLSTFAVAATPMNFDFGDKGCTQPMQFYAPNTRSDNFYYPPAHHDHKKVLLVQGNVGLTGGGLKKQGTYQFNNAYLKGTATLYRLAKNPAHHNLIEPTQGGQAIVCLVPKNQLGNYQKVK